MRSVLVKTSCGCAMPGIEAALWRENFEKACEAQFAKGRRKPVRTKVAAYVDTRAPKLGRKLTRIFRKHAPLIAEKVVDQFKAMRKADASDDDLRALIDGALSAAGIESLAADLGIDALTDDIREALLEQLREAYSSAAGVGLTEVGVTGDELPAMTEQLDEKAVQYAEERGAELVKDLAGTTMDDLRGVLSAAVEDGASASDLADTLEAMGSFGEGRANMIARTELAFAHVNGNVDGWRETGEVEQKRSILGDLHDEADECDDCAEAGAVGLDDDFVDGLSFPPYHPNCVCDVLPVLAADGNDAGSDTTSDDQSDPESEAAS